MNLQLSEKEVIIFLLIESGMSYRDLGNRLGLSYETVSNIYKSAAQKMEFYADSGKFQTELAKE